MKKITLIFMLLATAIFSWQSSAQLSYNNACTNAFDDISTTGVDLALGDDGEATITIPFGFTLDGVTSTDLVVGNNGGVLFGVTTGNVGLSNPTAPGFYPFADDIDSDYGAVYWETLGTAPNRRVVILWNDRPHFSNSPSGATFELVLHETTNEITFLYQDTDFGAGNTNNDAASAYIWVVGANGNYVYSTNQVLNGVTCINWVVPTCLVAADIVANGTGTTTGEVSWTDNNGLTATDYEYVVQAQGTGTPTVAGTPTTANPQPLTGLTASTAYEVYLRANCGSGDFSEWRKADFVTQCNPFNDFTEDFDSTTTGEMALCWSSYINSTSTSTRVSVESTDPNSGANAIELYNDSDDASDLLLITPNLADMQNTDHRIRFMAKGTGTDPAILVGTMTDPTDFNTFVPFQGIQLTNAYAEYSLAITSPPAGANYIAFQHGHGATSQTVRIDDFVWEPTPSCIEPSDIFVNAITASGASISWTENNSPAATNWDLYIVPTGDAAPDAATTPTLEETAQPVVWAGGTANTEYDVYVRTDCGNDNTDVSTWTGPVTFRTLCNAFTLPFNETFNSDSSTQDCWTVNDANADGDAWDMNTAFNQFEGDEVASINTDFNNGANDDYLITPAITLTGNDRLLYQYRMQSSGEPNDFELLLSTTGTAPADFTNTLIANTIYSNTTYVEEIVDLSAYTGVVYIAWHVPAGGEDGWRIFIDDVTIEEIPSCFEPSNLAVTANTLNGATFSWTESTDNTTPATNWDLYIVPTGDTAPDAASTPTIDNATDATATVWTGGVASTSYDVYVRADCAGDNVGVSTWFGPVTFETLCDTFIAPFTEDFETGTISSCWTQDTTDNFDWSAKMGATGSSGTGPSAAYSGDYYIYTETSSPVDYGDVATIYSPQIDISGLTNPFLKFAYHMYGAGMDLDGNIDVAISTDGGTTYSSIFNEAGNKGNQWNEFELLLTETGVVSFRISGTVSSTGTIYENDFAIDNFIVEEAPSCIKPSDLTATDVTNATATLSWTAGGSGESLYDIEIVDITAGGTVTGTATYTDQANPYSLTGLSETNDYEYYVRANCGVDGHSEWVGPFAFTTVANCIIPSDLTVTNIDAAAGTADFGWTDNNFSPPTNGWEYEIVDITAGGTATGTGVATATNPVSVTSLVAGNQYEFLVRAVCDTTSSSEWSSAYAWTQIDVPGCVSNVMPVDAAVVPVGFNTFTWDAPTTGGAVVSYDIYAGLTMALELGVIRNTTTATTNVTVASYSTTVYYKIVPKNAGGSATGCPIMSFTTVDTPGCGDTFTDMRGAANYVNNTNTTWTIAPDNAGDVVTVAFTSFNTEQGWDGLMVYNGPDTNSPLIDSGSTYNRTTCPNGAWSGDASVSSNHFVPTTFTSSDASGALTFVFKSDGSGQEAGWEADVTCAAPPTCSDPTSLAASNITDLVADLSWTENGTATAWDIEWGVTGFTQGAGTMVTATADNPYTLSGLTASTDYQFYVRANCSATYQSAWVGPFAFTTEPTPTCLIPADLTASNITINSADLGWTESNTVPATAWDVEWGTAGFTQGTGAMVVATADNPYNLSGLSDNTSYEFYVRSNCSATDSSTWVGPFEFTTVEILTEPCTPTAGTSTSTYIDNFSTTNGASNISNMATGISVDNYGDFTTMNVSGAPEDTFDFNIEIVGGTAGCTLWIDWDKDFRFDISEAVFTTTSYGNGPFTGTVTIPAGTPDGNYGMRIVTDWNDSTPEDNSCELNSGRGEFEDYTVVVDVSLSTNDLVTVGFNYYPNPVTNNLTMTANENITSIRIFNMLGQEVKNEKLSTLEAHVDMSNLSNGTYFVKAQVGQTVGTFKVVKK